MKNSGKHYTKQDKDRITDMINSGMKVKDIAVKMGRSFSSVEKAIWWHKLSSFRDDRYDTRDIENPKIIYEGDEMGCYVEVSV